VCLVCNVQLTGVIIVFPVVAEPVDVLRVVDNPASSIRWVV